MNFFHDNFDMYPMFRNEDTRIKQPKLFEPKEAMMLGNLFKDLYMTYNGFSNFYIQPKTQRDILMLEVQTSTFVAHEINLYLDMYPNNQRMIDLFHEASKKLNEAIKAYEAEFGPLTVDHSDSAAPFEWINGPWPWDNFDEGTEI